MSRHTFDLFGENILPNDPACHWRVDWVRTATGYDALISEYGEQGWSDPHAVVFEGFEFTPHDALLAFVALRQQPSISWL